MSKIYDTKIYSNKGNPDVLDLVDMAAKKILDVGCGAGDNARILKQRHKYVVGLTISSSEAALAAKICDKIIIADIEKPIEEVQETFDCIIMSHVCEHLLDPSKAIVELSEHLTIGGSLIIAVPNMAYYKVRIRLLKGNWQMEETGYFDRTHLHFYSYESVESICNYERLQLVEKIAGQPAIPLWPLRKIFPSLCRRLDRSIGRAFPNLFSMQVILKYKKK